MNVIRTLAIVVAGALAAAGTTLAADKPASPPAQSQPAATPAQAADIARIEDYLNGLTTAQAGFTLVGQDGQASRGQISLSRPSKLRFEYTDPKGNLLLADGNYVIFFDAQQKDASNLPISQTPLAFLLKQKVSLTDGIRVVNYEHAAGVIRVRLADPKSPEEGSVTVAFADQPIELRGWRLTDGQGQTTDVTFADWKFGMDLPASLFHFDPAHAGKRGR